MAATGRADRRARIRGAWSSQAPRSALLTELRRAAWTRTGWWPRPRLAGGQWLSLKRSNQARCCFELDGLRCWASAASSPPGSVAGSRPSDGVKPAKPARGRNRPGCGGFRLWAKSTLCGPWPAWSGARRSAVRLHAEPARLAVAGAAGGPGADPMVYPGPPRLPQPAMAVGEAGGLNPCVDHGLAGRSEPAPWPGQGLGGGGAEPR